jgi:1-acyl-sn-glycerol-3-phosphate acyltransferase
MWLPPRWVRRVVLAPAVVAFALAVLVTLPVWLLLALAGSGLAALRRSRHPAMPGSPLRAVRLLWIIAVYLAVDAAALVTLFGLWLASGFGWREQSPGFQRRYYALTGWFLRVLFRQSGWALRVTVEVQGPDPDVAAPGRPALVVSRHAGPGDSFLLIHALVNWYSREPRIVLKDTLQWDPAIDVLLNRLPSRFIAPGHDRGRPIEEEIAELATGLDDNDAFVIFPEGGNFTPFRRMRAIERLRSLGLYAMARRAEAMEHVLAPRPGGLLAALDAAPDAGVIFVAHTGLERMLSVADVWRELPMDKKIVMRWWLVPPDEVPAGRDERIDWLYDWWARIDRWIDKNHAAENPPSEYSV